MSRSVIITGASRGIGAATALCFARKGWDVAFCYHNSEEDALLLAEKLTALGVDALAFRADVGDSSQCREFIRTAIRRLGTPGALVCNAGIALPQDVITHVTDEQWHQIFAVHVDGMFYAVQEVLPAMIREGEGSIVTLSSMWGQVGGSCEAAYSAAKGAVISFTRALAKEVGPAGIRVNCVAPGVISTEMNSHLSPEDLAALRDETPLGRLGTPEEVARCIRFLCSRDASYLTGQVISPNGGMVI